jgi:hypothetical protein
LGMRLAKLINDEPSHWQEFSWLISNYLDSSAVVS